MMATTEDANKRIRQLFDGTQKQYKFFRARHVGNSHWFGHNAILDGTLPVPRFGIDYALENLTPETQESKTKNSKGCCELIERIDMTTKGGTTAFALVTKTVANECPEGNCWIALANLNEKCLPQKQLDCGTLLKNFGNMALA